jgi:hypothetical protein
MRFHILVSCVLAASVSTACGNSGGGTEPKAQKKTILSSVEGTPPPAITPGTNTGSTLQPSVLKFEINGIGNHAKSVCVPAKSKLQLRIKPHANYYPLQAYAPYPTNSDGTPTYDGGAAYYNKLRVRLSIQGSSAAWDYLADVEKYSVIGDYSSYLRVVPAGYPVQTSPLATPEYKDMFIYGSTAYDAVCTYWEKQLGKCSTIASELMAAEVSSCPADQQKILIHRIVSDYPCTNDKVGWCKGGQVQTVPDYQVWSLTLEAATEDTQGFN